jgi:hypothetical protein
MIYTTDPVKTLRPRIFFAKNLLNKKIIKISSKLTISEIINEAVDDAEVDDPTEWLYA